MEGTSLLIWGMVFGAVGLGFVSYGKRQKAIVPLFSGVGLLMLPFFLPNVYILVMAGVILVALPYFLRI